MLFFDSPEKKKKQAKSSSFLLSFMEYIMKHI